MRCSNFIDFIKESDKGVNHVWQRLSEQEREIEDDAEFLL
jgi:hypothetical protein